MRTPRAVLYLVAVIALLADRLHGADGEVGPGPDQPLLRYRLQRLRDEAIRREHMEAIIHAGKASREWGLDWGRTEDERKASSLSRMEQELKLPPVDSVPADARRAPITAAVPHREYLNLRYSDVKVANADEVSLDVYAPRNADNFPIVLWLHGGGMTAGDKSHPAIVALKPDFFMAHGYVFATANYRLAPANKFPSFVEDVAAAVAFVRERAKLWGADPDRIILIGNSAGAQLATVLVTNQRFLRDPDRDVRSIAGVVSLDIGTYDLVPIFQEREQGRPIPDMFLQIFRKNSEQEIRGFSPLHHIEPGKHIPPMLLMYVEDREHHRAANIAFQKKLEQHGYAAEVYAAHKPHVEGRLRPHLALAVHLGLPEDEPTRKLLEFLRKSASLKRAGGPTGGPKP